MWYSRVMRPSLFCGCFGEVLSQVFLQHLQLRDILHHGIHKLLEVFFVLSKGGECQRINMGLTSMWRKATCIPEKKQLQIFQTPSCLGRCWITRSTRSTRPVAYPIGVGFDLIEKPWLQLHRCVRLAMCYEGNWVGGCWWALKDKVLWLQNSYMIALIFQKWQKAPRISNITCATQSLKKLSPWPYW